MPRESAMTETRAGEERQIADPELGWDYSARAYIAFQDRGDPNRTLLLDPVMLGLCGDVSGLRVADVGCGEGRFSRMLAKRGASVIGVDFTQEMSRVATQRALPNTWHAVAAAERLPFADGAFDICISYITLVDIVGFRDAIPEMARVLRPGGHIVAANLGFVTAGGWVRDDANNRVHYQVDRYAEEWSRTFDWLGIRIVNWHRPLSAYMNAYLRAGLILREFLEPMPIDESLRDHPDFEDWFRVPLFNVIKWQKPPI